MNNVIANALIEVLCFLEFSDENVLDPDLAVAQLERASATLKAGGMPYAKEFALACEDYADNLDPNDGDRIEFIRSLPNALGLLE